MSVGRQVFIHIYIYSFIILMQNNLKLAWKTSRKWSTVVLHLLPRTYKLVLCLTKTRLYNTNWYWRKGCCHCFGSTVVYFPVTLCKKLFFGWLFTRKSLQAHLEKNTLCETVIQTRGPVCLPQALSFDLHFTDCWRSPMLVPMLPGYSAEQ